MYVNIKKGDFGSRAAALLISKCEKLWDRLFSCALAKVADGICKVDMGEVNKYIHLSFIHVLFLGPELCS
jgi:hypothetical protein